MPPVTTTTISMPPTHTVIPNRGSSGTLKPHATSLCSTHTLASVGAEGPHRGWGLQRAVPTRVLGREAGAASVSRVAFSSGPDPHQAWIQDAPQWQASEQ